MADNDNDTEKFVSKAYPASTAATLVCGTCGSPQTVQVDGPVGMMLSKTLAFPCLRCGNATWREGDERTWDTAKVAQSLRMVAAQVGYVREAKAFTETIELALDDGSRWRLSIEKID